ncbi:class I SAM-dependent methyltransferase [Streptomyces sp. ITFR-16]|uniref:class I SAM-dependent methyltransferase n=1 Tax=Streptomyces sp. ITFR-16 TaxID=3075198 RepID=UPI00288B6619|nr:class I SAM-dependent methyltransferase [Streptomyces sp. ITFR-16]WNI22639.1 class I SAM-dependent methyltransferase [Streptomyces sp. ITFR-16]
MPEGWQWDSTLFRGSAPHYTRGRLPYAPGYAEVLAAVLGPGGAGRLLDAGCGPGTVALDMAWHVSEVVGLDPDADMLAEAGRRAGALGIRNVRWVHGRAEDLPAGLGMFDAVVFAQSFHWTDRERVAAAVRDMLAPGGAFVLLSDRKDPPPDPRPLPLPAPPYERLAELVRAHLGPVRRAGQGVLEHGTPGREELVLGPAGFEGPERYVVPAGEVVVRTADDLVAWVFSRSDSAPHLFADKAAAFEREVREALAAASPNGRFAERLQASAIRIWRKPRRAPLRGR